MPASEPQRLETVREYRILDSAAEPGFDSLAQLASYVCRAPVALITIVDARREWVKARIGWPLAESPREHSFSAHVIAGRDPLIVSDASRDARFADHPLVAGAPHLRFYAGVPLVAPDGHVVGALAVGDFTPRTLDAGQQDALRTLADQVVCQLELRRRVDGENRQHAQDQERFELLARATNDAVWDWNLITNEIWWNEGLRTLFGLRGDEVPTIDSWT